MSFLAVDLTRACSALTLLGGFVIATQCETAVAADHHPSCAAPVTCAAPVECGAPVTCAAPVECCVPATCAAPVECCAPVTCAAPVECCAPVTCAAPVECCAPATPACGCCPGHTQVCCEAEAAIDIESLTPEAQSAELAKLSQARLEVNVPDSADVLLGGRKMSTLGSKRTYIVPIPDNKKIYRYEMRVEVLIGGKKYFRRISVDGISAGLIRSYTITVPELEEGGVPSIDFDSQEIAPGVTLAAE